ncbi:hypothetical protein D3C76_1458400 [compost metagenome]
MNTILRKEITRFDMFGVLAMCIFSAATWRGSTSRGSKSAKASLSRSAAASYCFTVLGESFGAMASRASSISLPMPP